MLYFLVLSNTAFIYSAVKVHKKKHSVKKKLIFLKKSG